MDERQRLQEIEQRLLQQHPHWPQDKARWIAMQALGITPNWRRI